jgi:hypothetical protein
MAVLIKRSSVAGKVPTTASMNLGELAMNTNDGRLFMKANNGSGDTIVEITSVTSLLNKTITSSVTLTATEYANAMLVFSGALTGNTVITVPNTAHSFIAVNKTTGNYSLSLKSSGMTPSVGIVQGAAESLLCDTTGVYATASTTGVEFAKIIPVTANVTTDITYAGSLMVVTTAGVTITLGSANIYPAGVGFGILNASGGNITVVGNGTDTSEVTLPITVRSNDSYYLAADNVSKWHVVWYSNPIAPTFTTVNAAGLNVTGLSNQGRIISGTLTDDGTTQAQVSGSFAVQRVGTPGQWIGTSSAVNNNITSYSTAGNAKVMILGSTTDASNTTPTSGSVGFQFQVLGTTYVTLAQTGNLLVGTSADDGSPLQAGGNITSHQGSFTSTRQGNGGAMILRASAGTYASPTALTSGSQSGTVTYRSYDGANYQDNASIDSWVEATTTNTSSPGNLRFYTTPTGAITKSERMRITARGGVLIGGTSDDGASALQVTGAGTFTTTLSVGGNITSTAGKITGTNSTGALVATNGSGTGQTSVILTRAGGPTDQKQWEIIQGSDGSFGVRTVNDGYSAAQYAMQIGRSTSYNLSYMELMPNGGNVVIGSTTDDGVNELQVHGTVKSTGGFVFPDGTTQTTANGVTAPTSTVYTPANGVVTWGIGAYNVGFVQVFKNNLRLIPTVDFTATDGLNVTLTTAATGRDRYEVLTSVVYSPSVVFAPTSYTTSLTSGVSLITTSYNVGCVWLFKNNMKMLPTDFTATNGSTITLTNASDSSTDVYEVVTFQPFAVNGMLPLTGGTMSGNITFSTAAAANNTIVNANAGVAKTTTYQTGGVTRFVEGVSNDAESGSNAGSNWYLGRSNDAGVWIDNPLFVSRQTGLLTLGQGLVMPDGYTQTQTQSGRNRITNGSCRVTQRGAGSYGNGVSGYSAVDGFNTNNSAGGVFSQTSGTITYNSVARKAVVQTVTTAGAAFTTTNLWLGIQTRLEGQQVHDFLNGYGSLSFIWNTNVTGTFGVQIFDNTGSNSYVTTFMATANVPTRVTIPAIPFPATLGIPNTNVLGLLLTIGSITGPSYQTATLNAWQTGNIISSSTVTNWASTVGNFISMTELQLEPGKSYTPFEQLHPAVEFSQCQRYLEIVPFGGHVAYNQGAAEALFTVYFNTQKKSSPTLSAYSLSGVTTEVIMPAANITSVSIDRASTQHCQIGLAGSGGSATQGMCGRIIGTGAGYLMFSCEL